MLKAFGGLLVLAVVSVPTHSARAGEGLPAVPDRTQVAANALLVLVDRSSSRANDSK